MSECPISKEQREEMIREFEGLLMKTGREGIEGLLDFIRKSDFYTAPASTKYHSHFEGGLLYHSLEVFRCLEKKTRGSEYNVFRGILEPEDGNQNGVTYDSIIIAGLLHDLCKTYYYGKELKNQKTYDPEKVAAAYRGQVKHDSNGDFIWETVPVYTVDNKIPYGHGEKSVMMIEEFIRLKPAERYAIRWHMGFTEPKEAWGDLGEAIKRYPLVLALMEADQEATFLTEAYND